MSTNVSRPVLIRSRWRSISLMLRRRLLRALIGSASEHSQDRFAVFRDDAISEEILVAGLYEEATLLMLFEHLFKGKRIEFAGSVAVDVGANIGNHTVFMARYFARVIAFEPNPTALALLRCNVALANRPGVEVFGLGLADSPGTFAFMHDESGNLGGSGFAFAGGRTGSLIACDAARGDDLLTPAVLNGPLRLIKLDIEGAELAALKGLRATLLQYKPFLLFESNRAGGPDGGLKVFAFLRELGYSQFFSVEEVRYFGGRFGRLLTRLLWGERLRVESIESPNDPPYSLLVAVHSTERLLP